MFICKVCDFEFEVAKRYREPHGEKYYGCPSCGSTEFVEAEQCISCGVDVAETVDGVCRRCLSDIDTLIEFGQTPNQVNAFLSDIFSTEEIDEILSHALRHFLNDVDVRDKYTARVKQYVKDYEGELVGFVIEKQGARV